MVFDRELCFEGKYLLFGTQWLAHSAAQGAFHNLTACTTEQRHAFNFVKHAESPLRGLRVAVMRSFIAEAPPARVAVLRQVCWEILLTARNLSRVAGSSCIPDVCFCA